MNDSRVYSYTVLKVLPEPTKIQGFRQLSQDLLLETGQIIEETLSKSYEKF